jgi:CRISPR-associated protein Cas2
MLVVVTYDVSTVEPKVGARRLRRVAKVCESYGVRVQKSVFECQVGASEWIALRAKLLREVRLDEDSLRFYFIDQADRVRIEHHGIGPRLDLETDPLIV